MSAAARRLTDAFLAGDVCTAAALLAPDACFHSPIRDYLGAGQVRAVWDAVAGVVQDAVPTSIHERDRETIAVFTGTIKDQAIDGVLRTVTDADDRASEVTLMIRPWSALKAGLSELRAGS